MRKLCLMIALGALSASASTITSIHPDPFSNSAGGFQLANGGTVCFPTVCSENNFSSNYQYVGGTPDFTTSPGNEIAKTTATFQGDVYESMFNGTAFVPGAFLGHYSVAGEVDFEFLGRANNSEVGDFSALLLKDDFTATAFGHTFSLMLDPAHLADDTGTLSINQVADYSTDSVFYTITLDFPMLAGILNVDSGQPGGLTGVPTLFALDEVNTGATVPEPATLSLLLGPVLLMLRARRSASRVV